MNLGLKDYLNLEYDRLFAAVDSFRTLLPHPDKAASIHSGEEGQFLERLLAQFLREKLPKVCSVGSGFIVNLERELRSYQTDIIVYDEHLHAPVMRYGDAVVVDHRAVIAAVSVKRTLTYANIASEVRELARIGDLCGGSLKERFPAYLALVGFSHESTAQFVKKIEASHAALLKCYPPDVKTRWSLNQIVNDILVIGDFVIHRRSLKNPEQRPKDAKFVWMGGEGTHRHYYLQVLLKGITDVISFNYKVDTPVLLDGPRMNMKNMGSIPICAGNRPPVALV